MSGEEKGGRPAQPVDPILLGRATKMIILMLIIILVQRSNHANDHNTNRAGPGEAARSRFSTSDSVPCVSLN